LNLSHITAARGSQRKPSMSCRRNLRSKDKDTGPGSVVKSVAVSGSPGSFEEMTRFMNESDNDTSLGLSASLIDHRTQELGQ